MASVPPGYRFYPTEEELIGFYLQSKLQNTRRDIELVIPVVDVYRFDPWQLPAMSGEVCRRDGEQWLFLCPRQQRETNGGRPTRTTPSGYWKATGSPSLVYSSENRAMGVKRSMVFYQGRAPSGSKTKWKMNEYRALEPGVKDGDKHGDKHGHKHGDGTGTSTAAPAPELRSEFSLCRMYTKSGCMRSFDRRPGAASAVAAASDDGITQRMLLPWAKRSCSSDGNGVSQRCVRQRERGGGGDAGDDDGMMMLLGEVKEYAENPEDWL